MQKQGKSARKSHGMESEEKEDVIGLSNAQLEEFIYAQQPKHFFAGCFSVDNVPVRELSNIDKFALILNLSPAKKPGSHFVGLHAENFDCLNYFDSLAISPVHLSKRLTRLLSQLGRATLCLQVRQPLQSVLSPLCGLYALFFIMLSDAERYPVRRGLETFRLDQSDVERKVNDNICMKNIKCLLQNNKLLK